MCYIVAHKYVIMRYTNEPRIRIITCCNSINCSWQRASVLVLKTMHSSLTTN